MSEWHPSSAGRAVMVIIGESIDNPVLPLRYRRADYDFGLEVMVGHLDGSTSIVRAADLVPLSVVRSGSVADAADIRQRLEAANVSTETSERSEQES